MRARAGLADAGSPGHPFPCARMPRPSWLLLLSSGTHTSKQGACSALSLWYGIQPLGHNCFALFCFLQLKTPLRRLGWSFITQLLQEREWFIDP